MLLYDVIKKNLVTVLSSVHVFNLMPYTFRSLPLAQMVNRLQWAFMCVIFSLVRYIS